MRKLGRDPVRLISRKLANVMSGLSGVPKLPTVPNAAPPIPVMPAASTPAPTPNIKMPKVKTSPLKPRIGKM